MFTWAVVEMVLWGLHEEKVPSFTGPDLNDKPSLWHRIWSSAVAGRMAMLFVYVLVVFFKGAGHP
jgi:hypothetical protein